MKRFRLLFLFYSNKHHMIPIPLLIHFSRESHKFIHFLFINRIPCGLLSMLYIREKRQSSQKEVRLTGKVRALQTLNIYSNGHGIFLAQKFIDGKTNKKPVAQRLLCLMVLRNTIVTADAINCQKETVASIFSRKKDYVFAL